jgi:hypothetical protein
MKTIFCQDRPNLTVEVRSIFRRIKKPTRKEQRGKENATSSHGKLLAYQRTLNKQPKFISIQLIHQARGINDSLPGFTPPIMKS